MKDSPFKDWYSDKRAIGLLENYEKIFYKFKDLPINYCEVGIAHGESLQWARDYFGKECKIVGVDLYEPDMAPDDAHIHIINQMDSEGLIAMAKEEGPFDIIIDDGAHTRPTAESTFNALYPYLKSGGFYIIEDWGAGYLPQNAHCKGLEALVTELIWKYGGSIHNKRGNFALIESEPRRGYGGFMQIQK